MDGGTCGGQRPLLLAETLGLAMARRAAVILEHHQAALAGGHARAGAAADDDDERFAADNAVFTAVLDAAAECLRRLDAQHPETPAPETRAPETRAPETRAPGTGPAADRWCDALLQVIQLSQLAGYLPGADLPR
jgi:hypothetical protein